MPRAPSPTSAHDPLGALSARERERAQRLRRGLGATLILAVAAIILIARCGLGARHEAATLERGLDLLFTGLRSHPACLVAAQERFAAGAGPALIDPYPVFLIEATHRFAGRRFDDATPAVRAVFDALLDLDLDRATTRLAAVPSELAGRHELARLLADLSRRAALAAADPALYDASQCGP